MVSLAFTLDGVLPPQDYPMTFSQIKASILVLGPVGSTPVTWDADWRHTLVCMAETLVNDMRFGAVGEMACTKVSSGCYVNPREGCRA